MKHFLLTISIIISFNISGNAQRVDSLFTVFKKNIDLQKDCINMDEETEIIYYTLLHKASSKYLAELTNDDNPAIRCMIYIGLAQKKVHDSILGKIYTLHKNDSAIYTSCSGCVVISWRVNEWMNYAYKSALEGKIKRVDYESRIRNIEKKRKNEIRVIIPGARNNRISRKALLKVDNLVCSISGFKVVSFVLVLVGDNSVLEVSQSNKLTTKMKDAIRNDKTIGRVIIESIKVLGTDNEVRKMPPMSLIVEE